MLQTFKSLTELSDFFRTEKSCYEFLEDLFWKDEGPQCPHCASRKIYTTKSRSKLVSKRAVKSYRCAEKSCFKLFNVTTGTLFEGTKLPLRTWFVAIYHITSMTNGISSYNLAKQLGVSQKTAYYMAIEIRRTFVQNSELVLKEIVEADESFVGGKNKNRHDKKKFKKAIGRAFVDKTPVLGMVQRGGYAMAFVVPNTSSESLQPLIRKHVKAGAILMVDAWDAYDSLKDDYGLVRVKVKGQKGNEVDDFAHTNTVEGMWTFLKNTVNGTYRKVSRRKLQLYVDEVMYRYNHKGNNWFRVVDSILRSKFWKTLLKQMKRKNPKVPVPHLSWH